MESKFIIRSIRDIEKKDSPLSYRNEYWAQVDFQNPKRQEESKKINFIVERSPLGERHITLKIVDVMDYPCVDLIRGLRLMILEMDDKYELPK